MEDTNTMSSVTVNGGGAENAVPEKTPMSGGRRAALIAGILLGVLAVAYLAACVVTQTVYGSTAFPHTDVLGLDVSKLTAQQIETLWEEKSPQLLHDTAVSLTEKGERIGDVPLDTLGVTVTPQAASIAAGASQRYESWGGGALAWLRGGWSYIHSWFWQTSAVPQLTVDAAALDAACNELAASLNCTVVDGGYRLEKGEGLYITKPADGRMLDAGKLELEERLHLYLSPEGRLVVEGSDNDAEKVCELISRKPALQRRFQELARLALLSHGVEVACQAHTALREPEQEADNPLFSRYHMCLKGPLSHFYVR